MSSVIAISLSTHADAQFFGDPPDSHHAWAVADHNRPQPPRVEPGKTLGAPPSDAVVLFDGTEESFRNWKHVKDKDKRKGDWLVKDGALECSPGAGFIESVKEFGDCQLHLEWSAPFPAHGSGQDRGNSGVFLMGLTEVQVLDNYNNETYADGFAGAVYGVMPPMVNALKPPSEWQTYDIIFRRPIFKVGEMLDQGSMTVYVNGVLVQDHTPLEGGGGYKKRSQPKPFPEAGPLQMQDHGHPVRYRNIWYRELRKRPVDGGTDGLISEASASAKRVEIAAEILKHAESLKGVDHLLRTLESLCYQSNDAVLEKVTKLSADYVKDLKADSKGLVSRKDEVVRVYRGFKYMDDFKLVPSLPAYTELDQIMEANAWKK